MLSTSIESTLFKSAASFVDSSVSSSVSSALSILVSPCESVAEVSASEIDCSIPVLLRASIASLVVVFPDSTSSIAVLIVSIPVLISTLFASRVATAVGRSSYVFTVIS